MTKEEFINDEPGARLARASAEAEAAQWSAPFTAGDNRPSWRARLCQRERRALYAEVGCLDAALKPPGGSFFARNGVRV